MKCRYQGYGAKDFTWGALIVDMINTEQKHQEARETI
jgi:hypothetical protein